MIRSLCRPCAIVLVALCACTAAHAADKDATVTLNLKDADINALITTVSEVTGKNFIVDPRVKGKVTVISSSPMQPDALYQTFLSVLAVQGFAAVASGNVIKVVPETNARQLDSQISSGFGVPRDDIVTRVFTLNNASAAQLVPILRPLVPQWGQLAAYAPGNMLIVADRAGNVRRLAAIIADLDTSSDEGVQIITLQHAVADDVVQVLTTLSTNDKKKDPTAHTPAIIADTRTNSVVIAGDKSDRERLVGIVHQLDTPSQDNGGATQVIYLKYADAKSLAPILQGYAQDATSPDGKPGTTPAPSHTKGPGANQDVTVLSDKDTNALIVTAPPKAMQMVKQVIRQLDIRRAQVQVEAIIAEVSANKANQLGVDWAVFNKHAVAAAGILDPSTLGAIQNATSLAGGVGGIGGVGGLGTSRTGTIASAAAGLLGQGATAAVGAFGGATTFAALLHALRSDGNTNILSTPNITTLDNEEAKIEVGQQVPFLTGSYANSGVTSSAGLVNPFQTINRQDVGLTLGITPTINQGDVIRLKIELEDSSLTSNAAGGSGSLTQITNKRSIKDVVSVSSGQILVIGGLIGDQIDQSENAIPFLSKIPLLGGLFRYQQNSRTRQNLMVFIHPVILRNAEDINYYTRMKYDHVRHAQIDSAISRTTATPAAPSQPVLYEWDDYLATHNRPDAAAPKPGTAPSGAAATPESAIEDGISTQPLPTPSSPPSGSGSP
ncbi:MAG: type II secretion system protein GspD [Nevskiaceae bacterium]|nr:MAG: type II secretion system protein GspD [Nevskiaceae bacterium]TBR73331.1 MAG: type II secretion system protein GspD [Nevskiaceae bacterium]